MINEREHEERRGVAQDGTPRHTHSLGLHKDRYVCKGGGRRRKPGEWLQGRKARESFGKVGGVQGECSEKWDRTRVELLALV